MSNSDSLSDHYVDAARKLIVDLEAYNFADEREAFQLLGRTRVILAEVLSIVDKGGQR